VNSNPSSSLRGQSTAGRIRNRLIAFAVLALVVPGLTARAGNLTRSGASTSPGTAGASATQTTTQATTATSQSVQTSVMAQRAQFSLLRSTAALQAIQAAQNAARNLSLGSTASNNLGTATQPLVMVPDGLAVNGLVPGVKGTDAADPTTTATPVPVTVNANGTASVNLPGDTAVTLPPNATASSQVTVSGTGTVGSITTGGTITALKAGVATTVAPGSTISLTQAGTISFASASAIPLTLSTYTLPASWSGISGLTQSTYSASAGQTGTPTTVTVTQTQQQAILTWQSFNIGRNTTLDFDQSLGGANVADWIAINKIADNIAPSQILGSIQAPGQVYVINQNGIIFGGSSQVNAGALVAASLPINDNLVSRGLLNNPDLQFLFSQLNLPAGSQGPTAAFTPQGTASAPGRAARTATSWLNQERNSAARPRPSTSADALR
jgi:filamentous hemagglutinin family protein